ncbi:hypothetical protein LCGC14_0601880 [marine sediment metagenome]|uniref:Uncharacterized protein n=1 Tax=marine sediment metagenome TaxID=412755 RepID=A0A0F9TWE2_9ZZZZ
MSLGTSMIQARKVYADGITSSIELSRMFKVSPGTINLWKELYDFEGYTNRKMSMLAEVAVDEVTSKETEIPTALNLLKTQLLFAVREGDIPFNNIGEVKQLIETMHLVEGKPTSITLTLDDALDKKKLSDMTGPEVLVMATRYVDDGVAKA